MWLHNADFRLRGFTCVIAILIICPSSGYGSSEVETSYENGIKGVRDGNRNYYGNPIKNTKRTVNSTSVGLWFGPRLGKRRKSTEKPEIDPQDVETIVEALNTGTWALISIPRHRRAEFEKRQPTQFTPRLGRELPRGDAFYDVPSEGLSNPDSEVEEQAQLPQNNYAPVKFAARESPDLRNILGKFAFKKNVPFHPYE